MGRGRTSGSSPQNRWEPEHAHRHLFRFLERDLLAYLEITSARVEPTASTATRRGALRTRAYLLRAAAVALAPIAPFTAEAVHRRLLSEPRSLFETLDLGADRTLIDDELSSAWDRWQNVTTAADSFRRAQHLPPETVLPLAALVLSDEDVAARLRADRTTLERLVRIARLEVTSPKVPWAARAAADRSGRERDPAGVPVARHDDRPPARANAAPTGD